EMTERAIGGPRVDVDVAADQLEIAGQALRRIGQIELRADLIERHDRHRVATEPIAADRELEGRREPLAPREPRVPEELLTQRLGELVAAELSETGCHADPQLEQLELFLRGEAVRIAVALVDEREQDDERFV